MVESKRGAVAWAMRQRSVSSLRSSNRSIPNNSHNTASHTETHIANPEYAH